MEQYEETTRTISRKRATKVEIPFLKIVRIPVRTQLEADIYLKKGVAIFEETISSKVFGTTTRYYIEVSLHDLADIACK